MNRKANLSVVTYTYNDHGLLRDLLGSMDSLGVVPREIIIVDNGSDDHFELCKTGLLPTVIIKNKENLGPDRAKKSECLLRNQNLYCQ